MVRAVVLCVTSAVLSTFLVQGIYVTVGEYPVDSNHYVSFVRSTVKMVVNSSQHNKHPWGQDDLNMAIVDNCVD